MNFSQVQKNQFFDYKLYVIFADQKDSLWQHVKDLLTNGKDFNVQATEKEVEESHYQTYDLEKQVFWLFRLDESDMPKNRSRRRNRQKGVEFRSQTFGVYFSTIIDGREIILGVAINSFLYIEPLTCEIEWVTINPRFSGKGICKTLLNFVSIFSADNDANILTITIVSDNYLSACICYLNGVDKQKWPVVKLSSPRDEMIRENDPDPDNKNSKKICETKLIENLVFYRAKT